MRWRVRDHPSECLARWIAGSDGGEHRQLGHVPDVGGESYGKESPYGTDKKSAKSCCQKRSRRGERESSGERKRRETEERV